MKDFGRGFQFAGCRRAVRRACTALSRKTLEQEAFAPEFLNRVDDVVLLDPIG